MIIPIGVQCTNKLFKQNIKLDSETLPFDWMFSSPNFVYKIMYLLLKENMEIEELVRTHFLRYDKNVIWLKPENYCVNEQGYALLNSKYNVIFPHETPKKRTYQENIDKYIRRFKRL